MSVVVQCLSCAQQFDAPEEVRGRRVQCPACGAAINVPPAVKSEQVVMPPSRGGMMDLLREESRPRSGGLQTAKGFDKNTIAALGISERKLFSKAKSVPEETAARPLSRGPLDGALSHKLAIGVAAASVGFLALLEHLNYGSAAVITCSLGILLAMATGRSQALANSNRKVADDWRMIERWMGFMVVAAIFAAATWRIGSQIYAELAENVPREGFTKTIGTSLGLAAGIWFAVVVYCLLMLNRSSRIGFFRAAAWCYIISFLVAWALISMGKLGPSGAHEGADSLQKKTATNSRDEKSDWIAKISPVMVTAMNSYRS